MKSSGSQLLGMIPDHMTILPEIVLSGSAFEQGRCNLKSQFQLARGPKRHHER
jgi:hypothetical protein